MKYFRDIAFASFLVACTVAASFTTTVPSIFLEDGWGVVTDPRGLKKPAGVFSDRVEGTLIQLGELEGVANIEDRLERIRFIVKDLIDGTQTTIAIALS